jgi:hypothetical protein
MPLNEIAGMSFTVNELPGPVAELGAMLGSGEGNNGEDVKEYYFYLDATPMHSYLALWNGQDAQPGDSTILGNR